MQRINKEQKNENIIKEWIKNIKIQRIMAIKEATKMIWR